MCFVCFSYSYSLPHTGIHYVNAQVQFINQKIDEARPGSRLHGLRHIRDPSDEVQIVHIAWMQFFMFSRRQRLNEDDVAEIHARAVHRLDDIWRRAALFDHTVRGALSPAHTSRALAFQPRSEGTRGPNQGKPR